MSDAEVSDHTERLRQQTVLAKFGELALRSNDLDEILTEGCRLVGEALGTDLAKVMQLQDDGETLLVRAGVGWKPGVVGRVTVKAADNTSEGHALKTGAPMISTNIATETRFSYPPFLSDNGVKAVANVLIIGPQEQPPFGILQIDSREPRQFTDSDTVFLSGYANLLAAAVDRLRMIADVRKTAAQLRESLDRQQAALATGLIGFFEWNVSAGLITADRRFASFYGLDPEIAAAGLPLRVVSDVVHPDDRALVEMSIEEALAALSDYTMEFRLVRPGGDVRWVLVRGHCYDHEDGRPLRYTGTTVDVTASKATEERLRRANDALEATVAERTLELTEANDRLRAEAADRERAEEALRQSHKMEAVGQLTGGLAHDFNNLLGSISGSLELLRVRAAQGRTTELGRYIDAALASADRAATLTHRLLAFSRRQTLDPKPTNLNRRVSGMQELFRRTLGPAIRVDTKLTGDLWPTWCDPNQLESALLNIVINARDAMPGGGNLMIETVNTVLSDGDALPGEYVALSVADTGSGMPPDVIARAFDPFFTTKPRGQGTGLGLSMTYGFVEQSGGHIRLQSEEGHGTTVKVYLPRHLGAVDDTADADGRAAPLPLAGSGVVLVVEDEPDMRMVVCDVLSDLGYTVLEAEHGWPGLNIVESGARIDLLLTDVGLPGGMNGRELADAARHRRPGLKVLFMTGYAEGAVVGNGRMEPGMEVMTKPFAVDALAARVHHIISHDQPTS